MKLWTWVLMAVLLLTTPARLPAAPATFEIAIYEEDWAALGHPQTAEAAMPALRKLRDRPPFFTVRAEDVESYLWQTQRITLTREASARLNATLARSWPELTDRKDESAWQWPLHDHAFLVRLDGEVLYGGLFVHPDSAKAVGYPVIHPEVVDGQGIFYLLPIHLYPGRAGEFEETAGSSRWFVRSYRKDPDPFDPADEEEPEVMRFRRVLRELRVRSLFGSLGKLVPAPLPPRTPAEVRTALLQTDHEIDSAFANGSSILAGRLLADSYRRVPPLGPWLGKSEILDEMKSGSWSLPFYVALAKEEPLLTDGRKATRRVLIALRGKLDGHEVDLIEITTRRYEFTGERWLLKDETLESCGDDSPYLRGPGRVDWRLDPCWPPVGPPRSDPRLDVALDAIE